MTAAAQVTDSPSMRSAGGTAQRRCIATGARGPSESFLRLVPHDELGWAVDVRGRMPGRAWYVLPDPKVLRSRGFGRALARATGRTAPLDVDRLLALAVDSLRAQIARHLGLGRRSGALLVGRGAVEPLWDTAGATLLAAEDLSERSWRSMWGRRDWMNPHKGIDAWVSPKGEVRLMRLGTQAVWGDAVGRGPVGILGFRPGSMAERLWADGVRLVQLLGGEE